MADDDQATRYLEIDKWLREMQRSKADAHALKVLPIIREIQATGLHGHRAIARALNAGGVPTAFGYKWYHATVRNLLARAARILPVPVDAAPEPAQAASRGPSWPPARTTTRKTL